MSAQTLLSAAVSAVGAVTVRFLPTTIGLGFVFQVAGYGAVIGLVASALTQPGPDRRAHELRRRKEPFTRWGTMYGFGVGLLIYIGFAIAT
jgi:hypothetical protein